METAVDKLESTSAETPTISKLNMSLLVRMAGVCLLLGSSFILPQNLLRTFFILFLLGNTMFYVSDYIERLPKGQDDEKGMLFLKRESSMINTIIIALASIVSIIAISQRYTLWS